jgi:hypothetical protein
MKRFAAVLAFVAVLAFLGVQGGDVNAASALSTAVSISVKPTLTGTVGLATTTAEATALSQFILASGTGANQGDLVYSSAATITTGATLSLDLKGSLVDAFGAAFTPAKVKLVYIMSKSTNTTNLTILGNAAAVPILNTVATTATLGPGDLFLITRRGSAGIAVTAATGDLIEITNAAGASAVVDIVIIGASA